MTRFTHTVRRTDHYGSAFVAGTELPVLVADREERVHEVVRAALVGLEVAGCGVVVRSAFSADEARAALDGVGVLLIEAELGAAPVLETLREERGDLLARALVRVETPDVPFDEAALERLGIDGFIDPDDLATPLRIYAAVRTALRAHVHATALRKQVDGLGVVAEKLPTVNSRAALVDLLTPLVEDVARNCWTNDYLCVPFLDQLDVVVAGGAFPRGVDEARALVAEVQPLLEGARDVVVPLPRDRVAVRLLDPKTRGTSGLLLLGTAGPVPPRVQSLAQGLGHKLAIARQNIDLSQKLEREKQAAQEIYNDRMGMLGRLAASVAHELNTPLGIALHASSLVKEYEAALQESLAEKTPLLADLDEAVDLIVRNVNAAASLVRSFKSMAVDQASDQVERFDPARIVADSVASLAHVLRPKGQSVRIEAAGGPVELTNNPGALSQVVNNLVLNAAKHGYDDGPGEIVVRHSSGEGRFRLEVQDGGKGMDERAARRIFEPFATTAKDRGGSGLGMSIVHQIVTVTYRGTIAVESAPGAGTTFKVELPA